MALAPILIREPVDVRCIEEVNATFPGRPEQRPRIVDTKHPRAHLVLLPNDMVPKQMRLISRPAFPSRV